MPSCSLKLSLGANWDRVLGSSPLLLNILIISIHISIYHWDVFITQLKSIYVLLTPSAARPFYKLFSSKFWWRMMILFFIGSKNMNPKMPLCMTIIYKHKHYCIMEKVTEYGKSTLSWIGNEEKKLCFPFFGETSKYVVLNFLSFKRTNCNYFKRDFVKCADTLI